MDKKSKTSGFVALGATISKGLKEELKKEAETKGYKFSVYIESILVMRPEIKSLL